MKLVVDLEERKAEALADLAEKSGMEYEAKALRNALKSFHKYHFALKVEMESDEPVSHDQTEPNDPIVKEFEFSTEDIADFVAKGENIYIDVDKDVSRGVFDMLYYMPDYLVDLIADYYAEKEGFKYFIAERKGE